MTYKPGWQFSVEPYDRYDETVRLTIAFDAPDTSSAPLYNTGMFSQKQDFYLFVGKCEFPIDVYEMVWHCIDQFETHENREFFRVGDACEAPFHPHTSTGMYNWVQRHEFTTQRDLADVTIVMPTDLR